jgi:hypothetical protein
LDPSHLFPLGWLGCKYHCTPSIQTNHPRYNLAHKLVCYMIGIEHHNGDMTCIPQEELYVALADLHHKLRSIRSILPKQPDILTAKIPVDIARCSGKELLILQEGKNHR